MKTTLIYLISWAGSFHESNLFCLFVSLEFSFPIYLAQVRTGREERFLLANRWSWSSSLTSNTHLLWSGWWWWWWWWSRCLPKSLGHPPTRCKGRWKAKVDLRWGDPSELTPHMEIWSIAPAQGSCTSPKNSKAFQTIATWARPPPRRLLTSLGKAPTLKVYLWVSLFFDLPSLVCARKF